MQVNMHIQYYSLIINLGEEPERLSPAPHLVETLKLLSLGRHPAEISDGSSTQPLLYMDAMYPGLSTPNTSNQTGEPAREWSPTPCSPRQT